MPIACVLMSDISGSTGLYERESNAAALEQIAQMLDRMRVLVEDAGGHCVKSQGDDVLSFFGDPDSGFAAAWAMMNEDWPGGLSVHAGMYMGEILAHEQDIYGNSVNTAARLAALAKPGEVLVGDESYDALSPDAQNKFLQIGELQLKGKAAPTRVYACSMVDFSEQTVVTIRSTAGRAQRTASVVLTFEGQSWVLEEGESLTIGRSSDCDIVIREAWVSRRHAQVAIRRWQLEFADHSSSGSIVQTAEGKQISVHRGATLLTGSGTIFAGTEAKPDSRSAVSFVSHSLELT